MTHVTQSDCEALLALTGELYDSIEEPAALPVRFLGLLRSLISFELGGCHLIRPTRHEIVACYAPERPLLPTRHKEFWRLAESHPLHAVLFAQPARAWRLSDVISRQAFQRTEFYNVLYRPLRLDCELTAAFPDSTVAGRFCLVSLHRNGTDFTERDRVLLNLLLPHIAGIQQRLASCRAAKGRGLSCLEDAEAFHNWVSQHTRWGLSRRESEVLFWLCQGKTNSEIGSILGIAGRTAETHTLRIYPKMGVENRYTAIASLNQLAILVGR